MNPPLNQLASLHVRPCITDDYSLEVTVRDISGLVRMAKALPPSTQIAIPFLPTDDKAARVAAIRAVRQLGFEAMPHFAARRITSASAFDAFMTETVAGCCITRCFVVAGDPPHPLGPFPDSASLIATGAFEQCGIETVGIGGHPEGHPVMSEGECWTVLESKCRSIEERGMSPMIVTQFGFDADIVLRWLEGLRERGLHHPVRIGVPGPAGVATLMRFAAQCGVGASTAILAKYGISATRLLGTSGPEKFVDRLAAGLTNGHGTVRLHFYPFGNIGKTVDWISHYASTR